MNIKAPSTLVIPKGFKWVSRNNSNPWSLPEYFLFMTVNMSLLIWVTTDGQRESIIYSYREINTNNGKAAYYNRDITTGYIFPFGSSQKHIVCANFSANGNLKKIDGKYTYQYVLEDLDPSKFYSVNGGTVSAVEHAISPSFNISFLVPEDIE